MRVLFQTMALLLFGGPNSSQGNWFGLRCSGLMFHLCCCTLRTFTTEALGKLAAIIRVNLGAVDSEDCTASARAASAETLDRSHSRG